MAQSVTPIGLAALKSREGVRLEAYRDSVGVPTIGWGHTAGVRMGDKITLAQASAFLEQDIDTHAAPILAAVKVPLADHEQDALVSIAFNIGVGAFRKSTFLKRLNAGDRAGCAAAIMKFRIPAEIIPRREAERDQFLTPYDVALPKARSSDAGPVKGVTKPRAKPVSDRMAVDEPTPEVAYVPAAVVAPTAPFWAKWLGAKPPAPAVDRPGLKPGGDPALWDVQDALKRLGYEPILRDGLNGDRTRNSVRTARRRNGLPDGEEVDAAFRAALPGLKPAMVSKTRADADTREMEQQSPDLFAALKGLKLPGALGGVATVVGAASDAGLMDKIKGGIDQGTETLGQIQAVLSSVFAVGAWLYAHWWIVAAVVLLLACARAYVGWLQLRALWRQGRVS